MMNLDILEENKDITSLSNFKTKAIAKYYFEINNNKDIDLLPDILNFSDENNLEILFIGSGTNMLFAFDIFNGIVIKNNLSGWTYNIDSKILQSYSSEMISDIAESLENDYGQNIWHRFIGLPGSVGGAVFGNAGCFGLEVENNLLDVEVYNIETRQIEILSKKDLDFSYRNSILKETGNYFIISSRFDLSNIIEKYSSDIDNIDFRKNKQPKGNTCGSFFKNPSREFSAGFLIEDVGLKGKKISGAYFSEKHANFLMSDGTAGYKDLLEIIDIAKLKVKEKYKIDLENEVRIIYNK